MMAESTRPFPRLVRKSAKVSGGTLRDVNESSYDADNLLQMPIKCENPPFGADVTEFEIRTAVG